MFLKHARRRRAMQRCDEVSCSGLHLGRQLKASSPRGDGRNAPACPPFPAVVWYIKYSLYQNHVSYNFLVKKTEITWHTSDVGGQ